MILEKYSFGIGDRFCRQGEAQLAALIKAKQRGASITPVWNKSHREHIIIGTTPSDTRREADDAVAACGWDGSYFVDADHIGRNNVDEFIESSDFFTLDVADFISAGPDESSLREFIASQSKYIGSLSIPGIEQRFDISKEDIEQIAAKFLPAVQEAGRIYRHLESVKGAGNFVTEVSMDESDTPQTPVELFFILAAIAREGIRPQTIAPKFTGRFNKGVDYIGDVSQFASQFEQDIAVINFATKEFGPGSHFAKSGEMGAGLPADLKLSVHSGSDKFSIYRPMSTAMKKFDAGLHLKTAGTTWLEELTGLIIAGGEGLAIARQVYAKAILRFDELCAPYAAVIDIDREKLPAPQAVDRWDEKAFVSALRHNPSCKRYNHNLRQLLHVAYKIAAEMGGRYLDALEKYGDIIAPNVTENIYERHIKPIFMED